MIPRESGIQIITHIENKHVASARDWQFNLERKWALWIKTYNCEYLRHYGLIWVKRRYHKVKSNMNTKTHSNNSCANISSAALVGSQRTYQQGAEHLTRGSTRHPRQKDQRKTNRELFMYPVFSWKALSPQPSNLPNGNYLFSPKYLRSKCVSLWNGLLWNPSLRILIFSGDEVKLREWMLNLVLPLTEWYLVSGVLCSCFPMNKMADES